MSEALEELKNVASTSRDARLYWCVSHAHTALSYAQRGIVSQAAWSLRAAQCIAERHRGACNDQRALTLLRHVRQECKIALRAKTFKAS
jgi:hypothetical protein